VAAVTRKLTVIPKPVEFWDTINMASAVELAVRLTMLGETEAVPAVQTGEV